MTEPVIIDTGPIVAILSLRDQHHAKCLETFRRLGTPPVTCWPVLTEATWMLRHVPNGPASALELIGQGAVKIEHLDRDDAATIERLIRTPKLKGLQLADACLVRLSAKVGVTTIFTLDRRDFSRPDLGTAVPLSIIPDWPPNP
ncbi:MAG: type II toxin-antitoxin system VapC family toxin [Phycisphaerales bacterium]